MAAMEQRDMDTDQRTDAQVRSELTRKGHLAFNWEDWTN